MQRFVTFLHRHLPWIITAALITIQSAISSAMLGGIPHGVDKIIHFLIFGVLGWLSARAVFYYGAPRPFVQWSVLIGGAVLFAALDEWHQSLVPGRYPDFWDWCADLAGVITFAAWYVQLNQSGKKRIS